MKITDLDSDTLRKLGLDQHVQQAPKERKQTPKDQIRGHAASIMGVLAKLSQSDRKRVLEQAIKMNEV